MPVLVLVLVLVWLQSQESKRAMLYPEGSILLMSLESDTFTSL